MEDAKLQALHDTLAQLRGHQGLGNASQYSWQRSTAADTARHPAAAALPDNALYANFLPEGVFDPNSVSFHDGDGRSVKRDFSDVVQADDSDLQSTKSAKRRRKELRKEEKKLALKSAKLEAKKQAKRDEKQRLKIEAKDSTRPLCEDTKPNETTPRSNRKRDKKMGRAKKIESKQARKVNIEVEDAVQQEKPKKAVEKSKCAADIQPIKERPSSMDTKRKKTKKTK